MPSEPSGKQVYDHVNNVTHTWDAAGKLQGSDSGDTTGKNLNTLLGQLTPNGERVGDTDWHQLFKELGTDAATQLPLMAIPGGGVARTFGRAAASLLSGLTADRVMSGDTKSFGNSLGDAGLNTAVSMGLPGLLENSIHYSPPEIQGTGTKAVALKVLNAINPGNWSAPTRMMVRPGATQAVPANMGNIVKDWITSKGVPGRLTSAGIPATTLDKVLKNLFGFGMNAAIDSTGNKPVE